MQRLMVQMSHFCEYIFSKQYINQLVPVKLAVLALLPSSFSGGIFPPATTAQRLPLLPHTHHLLWPPLRSFKVITSSVKSWLCNKLLPFSLHSSLQALLLHLCCQLSIPKHFPFIRLICCILPSHCELLSIHNLLYCLTKSPSLTFKVWFFFSRTCSSLPQNIFPFPLNTYLPKSSVPLSAAFLKEVIYFFLCATKNIFSSFLSCCCSWSCCWD